MKHSGTFISYDSCLKISHLLHKMAFKKKTKKNSSVQDCTSSRIFKTAQIEIYLNIFAATWVYWFSYWEKNCQNESVIWSWLKIDVTWGQANWYPAMPGEIFSSCSGPGLYRVSLKTVATFVSWISQLPRGLEIPSWTFFNSPFFVDFKNIRFSIIWWNLHRDISKLLRGGHFKS